PRLPTSTLFPYTTLFRSRPERFLFKQRHRRRAIDDDGRRVRRPVTQPPVIFRRHVPPEEYAGALADGLAHLLVHLGAHPFIDQRDRKSTRLNSSHVSISY